MNVYWNVQDYIWHIVFLYLGYSLVHYHIGCRSVNIAVLSIALAFFPCSC